MKRWWVFIWWVFSILGAGSLELGGYFKTRSGFGGALQTCTLSRHDSGTLVVIYRKNDSVADLARPENVFSFVFPLFFPLSIFSPLPSGGLGRNRRGTPTMTIGRRGPRKSVCGDGNLGNPVKFLRQKSSCCHGAGMQHMRRITYKMTQQPCCNAPGNRTRSHLLYQSQPLSCSLYTI